MEPISCGIKDPSHELAHHIDPLEIGVRGTGDVDGRIYGAVFEKTMGKGWVLRVIIELPHNLAHRINPIGPGVRGAGNSDGGERGAVCQKALDVPHGIIEGPHDLALLVDPIGLGGRGTGDIDDREGGASFQKPMDPCGILKRPDDLATIVVP